MRSYLFTDDLTKVLAETYRHMYSPAGLVAERGNPGEKAGTIEIATTAEAVARQHLMEWMSPAAKKKNYTVDVLFPNFSKNYAALQNILKQYGKTARKDMPRIDADDLGPFKAALRGGLIDVSAGVNPSGGSTSEFAKKYGPYPMFSKDGAPPRSNSKNMADDDAAKQAWLSAGSPQEPHGDRNPADDTVNVSDANKPMALEKLKPVQQQVYFDKSLKMAMEGLLKNGDVDVNAPPTKKHEGTYHPALESTVAWATGTMPGKPSAFVISNDNFIIDGHHRFSAGMLIDPKLEVSVLRVDLPWEQLLPLALTYGDAVKNGRNL